MAREPWYESENPSRVARGASWRVAIWVIAIVLFCGLIATSIWAFKVVTSDVKGAGDATTQINSANNRINSQEWFHAQYAVILTADENLENAFDDMKAHPNDSFYQVNFTGLRNRCNEMVNNYNAEAMKVSRAKWLDPTLPVKIDSTDQATDCKERGAK